MNKQQDLKSLGLIHLAMLAGQIMICFVINFVANENSGTNEMLRYIGPIISIATITMSFVLYNKSKAEGQSLENLEKKAAHFRSAYIVRMALLEGGNLMLVIFMFLDFGSKWIYLIFFAVGIGVFTLIRPTLEVFAEDYRLDSAEKRKMEETSF